MLARFLAFLVISKIMVGCGEMKLANSDSLSPNSFVTLVPMVSPKKGDLKLAAATVKYRALIGGCLSGWTKQLTEVDLTVQIPDKDIDCQFRLIEAWINERYFGFSDIKSFAQGASFVVRGSEATVFSFTAIDQIDSPIDGAQTVNIMFTPVEAGGQVDSSGASANSGISIGGSATMDVVVSAAHIVSVDSSDGHGNFQFSLNCLVPIEGTKCNDIDLANAQAGLGIDIDSVIYFGDRPLELESCKALANQAVNPIPIGETTAPNGGVRSAILAGPAPLYKPGNNRLILAIKTTDGSCKYFSIVVKRP